MIKIIFGLLAFLMVTQTSYASKMIVTYRAPESTNDSRYDYDTAVLKLALEKTRAEYGDYELRPGLVMNFARAIQDIQTNTTPNYVLKMSYESRFEKMGFDYAQFPVDLGIVGYRVCFTNEATLKKLQSIKTLSDLKKFTIGQGQGWADVEILQQNGFEVVIAANYESLFTMVAAGRFDLFCRGANELLGEYKTHKNVPGLVYDKTFSLYYPLPRFFYTNAKNKLLIQRIQKGLTIAYNEGSLVKLWKKEYGESVKFANLKARKIFSIENPNLKDVSFDYKKYLFNPVE